MFSYYASCSPANNALSLLDRKHESYTRQHTIQHLGFHPNTERRRTNCQNGPWTWIGRQISICHSTSIQTHPDRSGECILHLYTEVVEDFPFFMRKSMTVAISFTLPSQKMYNNSLGTTSIVSCEGERCHHKRKSSSKIKNAGADSESCCSTTCLEPHQGRTTCQCSSLFPTKRNVKIYAGECDGICSPPGSQKGILCEVSFY